MVYCYFLPETRGVSVGQMDVLFGAVDVQTRAKDIDQELESKVTVEYYDSISKNV